MDAIALGPALISVERLYAFVAALVMLIEFSLLIRLLARMHARGATAPAYDSPPLSPSRWFNRMLVSWVIGARLTYVALHWASYQQAPLDILKLWQPGYHLLGGMLAATLASLWLLRRHGVIRQVIALGSLTLGLTAFLGLKQLDPLGSTHSIERMPSITLHHLDRRPVSLDEVRNQRVIVNLWATWCPPCRREMPLLAEVDARPDVTVVLANQGEQALAVTRFLKSERLTLEYALLDPAMQLMGLADAQGLPATLIFDGEGRLIERHIGELSRAQLQALMPPSGS
ncbi:TlpA disulfide reductase family protein [Cobetia sp. 5-11-6-3]|uniref:TlpA disulfide reductase family protein n=1 Tax=Cobetia sp. 5-11-6-3 TaxID=2737458 RepID=UPI0015964E70|nr:TlpA disulfide reductase family protein [Cobetia sp. 5-11-6-3]